MHVEDDKQASTWENVRMFERQLRELTSHLWDTSHVAKRLLRTECIQAPQVASSFQEKKRFLFVAVVSLQ